MGSCSSCFRGSTPEVPMPDLESRRRRQMEAAEKRRQENESRGIKDVERLRQKQQRQIDMERDQAENSAQPPTLKLAKDTVPVPARVKRAFIRLLYPTASLCKTHKCVSRLLASSSEERIYAAPDHKVLNHTDEKSEVADQRLKYVI